MKSFTISSDEYEEQRQKYLEIKRQAKTEARNEFEAYKYITLRESLEKNPKEFWSYVRECRGKQSTVLQLADNNEETITDTRYIENILNQHFKKCFSLDDGRVEAFATRISSIMSKLELNEAGIRNLLSQVDIKISRARRPT